MKCVSDRVLSHLAVFDHVHSIDTRVQMVVCFDPGQTSASKSTAERFNCWALRTDTSPMPLPLVQELWSYLDENEEGHIEYDEFVEALSVASEMINTGPVTWGKMHEDFEYDPEANSITATGSCLCVYLCVRTCGIRAWRIGTN